MADAGNVVHEDDRKLFVGALPQEAKDTDIKEYFGTFGDIENINLKMDPMTGRSRGFAFIVFKELAGIDAALAQTAHVVKGKKVTCKKAEARQGKVYVGKLPPGEALSKEDIQAHFEQFGSVVEVVRPVDKMKNNEPKTFAFITFAREDAAKQLVKQGQTTINDMTFVTFLVCTGKLCSNPWCGNRVLFVQVFALISAVSFRKVQTYHKIMILK